MVAKKKAPKKVIRETQLHIRVLEQEIRFFQDAAQRLGMSVSAWVRMTLRKASGMDPS